MTLPKEVRINSTINQTMQLAGYIKHSFGATEAIIQLQNAIAHLSEVMKAIEASQLKGMPQKN